VSQEYVYGLHAVRAALARSNGQIEGLWVDEGRRDQRLLDLIETAQAAGITVERVPRARLEAASGGAAHQGVVARRRAPPERREADLDGFLDDLAAEPFLLVLDGVQDPHNFGACLRSACAAGVQAVIVPRDHSAPLSPVVHKAASGAAEYVPVFRVANLARALEDLKQRGVWLVGASADASESLYDIDLTGPLALVLGGEGKGLRRLTRERCDRLAGVPVHGPVDSLNVSVAAGVCLYEALRQRRAVAG